ncbi:unnamed protein product, partial [Rotaria sp. Silwood1]
MTHTDDALRTARAIYDQFCQPFNTEVAGTVTVLTDGMSNGGTSIDSDTEHLIYTTNANV